MSADKQTRRKNRKAPSDFRRLGSRFMSGLLRSLFLINKPTRAGESGFVLPTTVLLLLVMTLTVGALSFRTVSRTQSVFLAREQKTIDNVAAPAVDRAKAKLEYLFSKDTRIPGSNAPPSDVLATLMLNIDSPPPYGLGISKVPGPDPYTLPDETRIDINNDNKVDNAWSFPFDINGDGVIGNADGIVGNADDNAEIIAYSVLMDDSVDPADIDNDPATVATPTRSDDISRLEDTGDANTVLKANNLIARNGPINTSSSVSDCGGSRIPAAGWQTVNSATLEKNFQITAFVSNGKSPGRANSALELQQVRLAQAGNTWGAWFKYDIEIGSSSDFNWNGAIHSDGSLWNVGSFNPHMISSFNSCLYTANSSDITMAEVESDEDTDTAIDISAANSKDFQGQIVSGSPAYSGYQPNFAGSPTPLIHLFNGLKTIPILNAGSGGLATNKDSVSGNSYGDSQEGIMMDPVAVFTKNVLRHRKTGSWSRDSNWTANPIQNRIFNKSQTQPFLDDFYRADNRYGPRPNYQQTNWVTATEGGTANAPRTSVEYDKKLGDEIISTDPRASNLLNGNDGLDGYWERQAISNGTRVVIGQRLELGNHLGWNFNAKTGAVAPNTDSLYPPNTIDIANKQKQRVTLRDNLAAVQGMVVYQYESPEMPLACIANTAHPGTLATLRNSRTFNVSAADKVKTDFFTGQGTNGWEFAFPPAFDTEAEFGTELDSTKPLGIALRNLAYFAGDPKGGSPSFTPVQDTTVHPFIHQSMWGDFSVLRRIFNDELDNNLGWRSSANPPALTTMATRYAALSPADKSSLHSAACTMGLLAYNVNDTLAEYISSLSSGSSLQSVGVELSKLIDGVNSNGNPEIESLIPGAQLKTNWTDPNPSTVLGLTCPAIGPTRDTAGFQANCDTAEYYQQFTTDNWVEGYRLSANPAPSAADIAKVKNAIGTIKFGGQLIRDRALGFAPGNPLALDALTGGRNNVTWDPTTGFTDLQQVGGASVIVQLSCDPDLFNQVTNSGGGGGSSNRSRIGLALVSCSAQNGTPIKYPSLYYLFPMVNHDHDGAPAIGELGTSPLFVVDHRQPTTEEYVSRVTNYGVNSAFVYKVLGDKNGDRIETSSLNPAINEAGYADIAFLPRSSSPTAATNPWKLPTTVSTASAASTLVNPESMDIKIVTATSNTNVALSLLDKVMYDGRQEMAVRVLDIDLGKLSSKKRNGTTGDYWISDDKEESSGILYAAREDAAREDSITRPASTPNWTTCNEFAKIFPLPTSTANPNSNCLMRASAINATSTGGPLDPPLSKREDGSVVGISIKPVDFVADPDRRPHGFRLNADLNNNKGDISNNKARTWGLTFVTDNAAYVKGNFNPHTSNGTDTIEEFTQTLQNGSVAFDADFYTKRTTSNLSVFATKTGDRWRVAEVLADAVSILSNEFVDGAIDEGFIRDADELSPAFGNARTSFNNQHRPLYTVRGNTTAWGDSSQWLRIDGTTASSNLPIWVGRNGESRTRMSNGAIKDFTNANNSNDFIFPQVRNTGVRPLLSQVANTHRVNATIISGIVPPRRFQSYGGMHNFPRFLEKWRDVDLFIQGAFLQLNFSTASTGPFDADAWDPGQLPNSREDNSYYWPPNRPWGYDVALQLVPTGPIAARFVAIGRPRSEHYRELPIEDPYVKNLRCSKLANGARRFAAETGCPT